MKSGIMTTEFWSMIITKLIALLVMLGVLNTTDGQTIAGALTNAVAAIAMIIYNAEVLINYTKGRLALKVAEQRKAETPLFNQELK